MKISLFMGLYKVISNIALKFHRFLFIHHSVPTWFLTFSTSNPNKVYIFRTIITKKIIWCIQFYLKNVATNNDFFKKPKITNDIG